MSLDVVKIVCMNYKNLHITWLDRNIFNEVKEDKNWLNVFIKLNYYNNGLLQNIFDRFSSIKNKKILDDFKKNINIYQNLDKIYYEIINDIDNNISFTLLKDFIFFGANINKDLLDIDIDRENYYNIIDAYNSLEKIKNFDNSQILEELSIKIHKEEEKIKCYNLIRDAYYAQKINRFIKYYYDDRFRLSKFKYNLEKNKYLRLIKNIT